MVATRTVGQGERVSGQRQLSVEAAMHLCIAMADREADISRELERAQRISDSGEQIDTRYWRKKLESAMEAAQFARALLGEAIERG